MMRRFAVTLGGAVIPAGLAAPVASAPPPVVLRFVDDRAAS
jgi:hypothetical protein